MNFEESDYGWLEAARQPINGNSPTGVDPREDITPQSLYYRLKDQRMQARNIERNAIVEDEPLLSHANLWRVFLDELPLALATQTKDLEYVAWLIEALTRLQGFRGMAIGYELATYYIENYWPDLYPMLDEEGIETRISPIIGLNGIDNEGTLVFPLACIPITEFGLVQAYSYWEYQQALEVERLDEDKKRVKHNQGAIVLNDILQTAKSSSDSFYKELNRDLQRAINAYRHFSEVLDKVCGDVTPSTYIAHKLDSIYAAVRHIAADKIDKVTDSHILQSDDESEQHVTSNVTSNNSNVLLNANVESRQEAIQQLRKVADFFRETEPHSPVSYTIEQVIRWCGMALPDLLAELISDGEAKNGYFRLVGIANKDE
ncbi:type VI secretion system protein TssA [Vibrio metschnikovii]|uniref:type VI secretion system protein TssA n=1 Tax=Vibrio metschnikovii TaxID=28172 RepID=UPI001C2FD3A3|nr:type VI secretion system protein TssA [Vibrio metschnikovii]